MADGHLAVAEAAYLEARSARDRLDVARARGEPADTSPLAAASTAAFARCRAALAEVDDGTLGDEDRRALAAMRHGLEVAATNVLPGIDGGATAAGTRATDDADPRHALDAVYAETAGALRFGGEVLTRPQVLGRLASEADAARRRRLFLALEPLWRAVDGDDGAASPYRAIVTTAAAGWREGRSPIHANAAALGVEPAEIEAWAMTALEAWRAAFVQSAIEAVEPWDWWWRAGEAQRTLHAAIGRDTLLDVNVRVHAALGADLEALGIVFDIHPRPGRPPVPVAYTTFGERPSRQPDGTWHPGRPVILETLTDGGLGELAELVHETGHAIHIAGIRTRPAFADWPDADALTEALAELVAADVFDPAWQRQWLPGAPAVPPDAARRARHAETALDAAWAVFEMTLLRDPGRRPNDVWTDITSTWLGIAPHPEWPWWAMRGQLVEEPGYMANYAVGAVLAADLRAAIRAARGSWIDGDPGWHEWAREHIYRFGLERSAGDVVRSVLGRSPTADALRTEMGGPATA